QPMELDIVAGEALRQLVARGLQVERAWCGTLLSALDMRGCSLSLLRVDDARLALLDAPTRAPAWPGGGHLNRDIHLPAAPSTAVPTETLGSAVPQPRMEAMRRAVLAAAAAIEQAEGELTDLDARAGDGDLGASLSRGAEALRALPDSVWTSPDRALTAMAEALRRAIAGSSGPFYATALMRAARHLQTHPANPREAAPAFAAAARAIGELGGAGEGDRTMLDALLPAARALKAATERGETPAIAWAEAAKAAASGAEATQTMAPRLGRASYLGARALGIPDGGAVAISIWLKAIAGAL
uniref:DAK2 domain-containing protein n=1 Tax=Aureimonas sp. AU40 TaxID=1637747 RepID=UPI000A56E07D